MRKRTPLAIFFVLAATSLRLNAQTAGWTGDTSNTTTPANVGIGMTSTPSNRLHVLTSNSADGLSIDGTNNPAINFRNAGTPKAFIGLSTASGGFFTPALANDLNIRSESNNIFLGRGSGWPTLAILGGNIGIGGITDPSLYVNTDNWFKPSLSGTNIAYFSANEAVLNAVSSLDANGAHIGGLYFTRSTGQSDAHRQVAAIQGRQNGTGNLSGGELWFFTKVTGGGTGVDEARMVIKNDGKVVIGNPASISATSALNVVGDINVSGNINAKYQDVAEWVDASEALEAGTVVVLDPSHDDQVMPSASAYDTSVAGVVSASPGLILGTGAAGKEKIATTGRVKVRVDATRAPIRIGDLLVTSDVAGTAMRSQPLDVAGAKFHRPGTVIGKALQALPEGRGEILVLLSLQ
jgi:hypothetical protein